MRNLYTAWEVICSVVLSCALNGIVVALVTLAILAWNNCVSATGHDGLVAARVSWKRLLIFLETDGKYLCGKCKEQTTATRSSCS